MPSRRELSGTSISWTSLGSARASMVLCSLLHCRGKGVVCYSRGREGGREGREGGKGGREGRREGREGGRK